MKQDISDVLASWPEVYDLEFSCPSSDGRDPPVFTLESKSEMTFLSDVQEANVISVGNDNLLLLLHRQRLVRRPASPLFPMGRSSTKSVARVYADVNGRLGPSWYEYGATALCYSANACSQIAS